MKTFVKIAAAAGTAALAGTGAVAALALDAPGDLQPAPVHKEAAHTAKDVSETQAAVVMGDFSFVQGQVSTEDELRAAAGASQYLCGSEMGVDEVADARDWVLTVGGAVENGYTATFAELAADVDTQTVVMGCACAGNPVDGRAAANAEVSGFSVARLIALASPTEAANTVVFTSADGYEVAIPYDYLQQRLCPLVFDVNGYPLASSVGGTNQLWLGSTAASYFARNVVSITLEERQTPPPSPASDEARESYRNLPNVGVLLGGEIR